MNPPLRLLSLTERRRGFAQTLATLDLLAESARRHPDRLAFARSGTDIRRAAGVAPGPDVGDVLKRVEAWWVATGCSADRAATLRRLHGSLDGG